MVPSRTSNVPYCIRTVPVPYPYSSVFCFLFFDYRRAPLTLRTSRTRKTKGRQYEWEKTDVQASTQAPMPWQYHTRRTVPHRTHTGRAVPHRTVPHPYRIRTCIDSASNVPVLYRIRPYRTVLHPQLLEFKWRFLQFEMILAPVQMLVGSNLEMMLTSVEHASKQSPKVLCVPM